MSEKTLNEMNSLLQRELEALGRIMSRFDKPTPTTALSENSPSEQNNSFKH